MKEQKETLIKPKKSNKNDKSKDNFYNLVIPIIFLCIGLVLVTNSSKAVIIVCYILGALGIAFGVYKLIGYYRLEKELRVDMTSQLILGIGAICVGLLVIILAGAIETFLRFIIGVLLIINGVDKIITSINIRNYVSLTIGIILVGIGLYTILAENIVFSIVGVFMILSSIIDIVKYIKNKA